ncbi:translation initiation factor eIF4A [Mortierella sp. NVP85]|nr:translation initiation factor eIF4A [Mortierella sp. NVP85]
MKEFSSGPSRILIVTHLLTRDFDIQQAFLITNYDFPVKNKCYVHRLYLFGRNDINASKEIEQLYPIRVPVMPKNLMNLNEPVASFEEIGLKPELLRSICEYGFQVPTKLQQDALPFLIDGRDMVLDAPVNSGKSTAACISILQRVNVSNLQCQALILTPSPETASRTLKVILALGSHNIQCQSCTDHADLREDRMRDKKGSQIVIGNPSYVEEMIRHDDFKANSIRIFFLDRVDEIFSEWGSSFIEGVIRFIPRGAQVIFSLRKAFKELQSLIDTFMRSPVLITRDTEKPKDQVVGDNHNGIADNQDVNVDSFDNMQLELGLLRGIYTYGNHDVIIQAQTGNDTIAAFSIPILQKLDNSVLCQALILAPTRALVQQIEKVVESLGRYMALPFQFLSDGINIKRVTILTCGPRIVVETPGSALNMIKSGSLKTSSIRMFVVYGADSMTSKGFRVQVHDVFQRLHSGTQAVFLSTEQQIQVTEIMAKFKREPIRIVVEKGVATESKADLRDRGREQEGAEAGDGIPPVANVQSPSNGHRQEGTKTGHSEPPVGKVYRLAHDNLQHQLRSNGHEVGKERKQPAVAAGRYNRKWRSKKAELTPEHSKDPYLPLSSDHWPQRDETVDNQDEAGIDGADINGNQVEIDNEEDGIVDRDGIDHNQGEIIDSFDNMKLKPELIRGINVYGRPSPLLKRAIPTILKNHDVIIQAQRGDDTFSAFSIPILQKLDNSNAQCQALILVPKHELGLKIYNVVAAQGKYMGIQSKGRSGAIGIEEFTVRNSQSRIVVETPGNVLNQIKSGNLKVGSVKMLFVYEANEMISNGFGGPIHDVFQRLQPGTQAVFLSTTLLRETMEIIAKKLTAKFMREPIRIVVEKYTGAKWYEEFLCTHGIETEEAEAGDSIPPVANLQSPSHGHGQGTETGDSVQPLANAHSPSNDREQEGTETRDGAQPVANDQSPSNGHGKEGTEARRSVPHVRKGLTHENLLQHQLQYNGHEVGKWRKQPTVAPDRFYRKGRGKKTELRQEHSKHFYVQAAKDEQKLDKLCGLHQILATTQAVIFCNAHKTVDWLTKKLVARKLTASAVHDDMDQAQREVVIEQFRSGSTRILITTDLLLRGSDALQASLIINFELPVIKESYIHRDRLGGREGRKGVTINFVTTKDKFLLREIEEFYSIEIKEMPKNLAEHI